MRWCIWILLLVALSGCGVGIRQKASPEGSLTIIVHFPPKRVIPSEAQRIRVLVSGQGLAQPLEKVAERPSPEGSEVRITFINVPIGPKTVTVTAEDQYGTQRAIAIAETNISAGQKTTVTVELALTNLVSVTGRLINIRTAQQAANVTVMVVDRQSVSLNDGFFAVTNVPEGEHLLTISSPEYRGYSKSIIVSVPLTDLGELPVLPSQLMEPPDAPDF